MLSHSSTLPGTDRCSNGASGSSSGQRCDLVACRQQLASSRALGNSRPCFVAGSVPNVCLHACFAELCWLRLPAEPGLTCSERCNSYGISFNALPVYYLLSAAVCVPVAGVICTPNAPPLISRYGLGLLELLLNSCPAVACATLLGPYTPELVDSKQQQYSKVKQDPDSYGALQLNGDTHRQHKYSSDVKVKPEPGYYSSSQQEGSHYSRETAAAAAAGGRSGGRRSSSGLATAAAADLQISQHEGAPPPPPPPRPPAAEAATADAGDTNMNGGYRASSDDEHHAAEDDGDGLYDELGSDGQQQGSEGVGVYDDINQEVGPGEHDDDDRHQVLCSGT